VVAMKQQKEMVTLPKKEGSLKSVPNYMPKTDRHICCNNLIESRGKAKSLDNIQLIWSNIHW